MLKVKKIVGNLLSSNMYLLFEEGTTHCWLIDVGDAHTAMASMPKGLVIQGVFLTHTHFDHIAGLNQLCECFTDCKIYTSKYGVDGLRSDKKNFSFYHEHPMVYTGGNVTVLKGGDSVPLFDGVNLHVMETPGHCPSCLCYYTDEYVFTGDSYIPDVPVVTKLPRGNKEKAALSVERILEIASTRTICPGHDKNKWVSML